MIHKLKNWKQDLGKHKMRKTNFLEALTRALNRIIDLA